MRKCLASLKKGVIGDDDTGVNFTSFDGNTGYDINELKDIVQTLPFFAERRLVIVENSGLFGADNGFADFISAIPEETVLVLVEQKTDKHTKLYKEIKNVGYVCEFVTPKPDQLLTFVAGYLGKESKRISQSDCDYFISSVGGDLYNITSELDKLIDFTGQRNVILKSDIDEVCSMHIENKIFDIVDMLMNSNVKAAMKVYFDLIALREPPLNLLRYILKQYMKFVTIRDEIDRGSSDSELAAELHCADWLARKYRARVKNFGKSKLIKAVRLCTDTENNIKNGNLNEEIGMEILLANLASL